MGACSCVKTVVGSRQYTRSWVYTRSGTVGSGSVDRDGHTLERTAEFRRLLVEDRRQVDGLQRGLVVRGLEDRPDRLDEPAQVVSPAGDGLQALAFRERVVGPTQQQIGVQLDDLDLVEDLVAEIPVQEFESLAFALTAASDEV